LLEPETLGRIARSERSKGSEARAAVERRVGKSLLVESEDARRFTVSASGSSPAGAQRLASEFARSAAANVASIFGDAATEPGVRASFRAAPLPSMPERPNRALVILLGLTIGMVWGAGAAVGQMYLEALSARRPRKEPRPAAPEVEPPPTSNPQAGAVRELVAEVLRPREPAVTQASISARPVSVGWRPDPSVNVALRRELCEEILPFVAGGCFVIGVTAVPEVDPHKSRVASELAFALTEQGQPRVLLLEADFHSPDVHRVMGLGPPAWGSFSDQLRARGGDDGDPPWQVVDCGRSLHVIAEGSMGSPGMLLSTQFGEAVRSLRTYYDVIVINGPLASNELDCRVLDAVVDGVIVASTPEGSPYLSQTLGIFKRKRFSKVVGA
jgi:Mrp family chromosome partitioning ATPase